ncbi:hypothetical protein [Streptomyces flavofungini]|uniref:hypothetical protein n=1 Tax=Streptomyces flavofungini TaxID=68200 RepID=UPI0025AF0C23|nr:hypothetical protein [Streptomyces flavofungini]WJV47331.1 hypothetical protein QUY26_18480 [Streptomyces flavofungini]
MDIHPADGALSDWFARAQPGAAHARREWAEGGVALLPCGPRFCAVRLSGPLVYAALGTDMAAAVAVSLATMLSGPVFCSGFSSQYYALVAGSTPQQRWSYADEAPLLGTGTYLGVPAVRRTSPPGPYWVSLPHHPGDLCPLPSVAALVALGLARSAEASR